MSLSWNLAPMVTRRILTWQQLVGIHASTIISGPRANSFWHDIYQQSIRFHGRKQSRGATIGLLVSSGGRAKAPTLVSGGLSTLLPKSCLVLIEAKIRLLYLVEYGKERIAGR